CDQLGRALLARRSRSYKLLAILVLGRLRDKAAWADLSLMTNRTDSIISIYAFWALVRIDPEAACRNMMPLVASRMDWPVSRIVLILQEAGEAGSQSVRDTLSAAHTNHMPRLMHIAAALRIQVPTE